MNKLLASTLGALSLICTAGLGIAGQQADLSLDPARMFFRYTAPGGVDSGDFQVYPDNRHNPIVVPCDTLTFGGQLDINYLGTGPTVYPDLTFTFFDANNNPITSTGCLKNHTLTSEGAELGALSAGSTQSDGYMLVSSTNQFCDWLFQPGDLPADTVVRIHTQLTAYSDLAAQNLVTDPNPGNNAHDIYVRRACSCQ